MGQLSSTDPKTRHRTGVKWQGGCLWGKGLLASEDGQIRLEPPPKTGESPV